MGTEAIPGPPELDSLQRGPSPAPLDASHAIDPPAARESSHLFASYRDDWTDVSSQYIGDSQSYTPSYADSASSSSSFVERDLPPPLLSQQLAFNNNTTSTHGDLATEDPRQGLYRFVEKLEMSYTPIEVDRAVGGGAAQDGIPAGGGSHGIDEGIEEGMLDARRAGWVGDSSLDGMEGYETRSYGNDSSIMDGVVPYCRPEGMFNSMLSDSPPSNRLSASPTTEMHSFASSSVRPPPALQPLDIASAAGPSLHLIAPTPSTTGPGRKKPKGKGTLELESLLGRLVNEEAEGEDNEERFSFPTDDGLSFPSILPSVYEYPSPSPDFSSVRRVPTRQRSKSETDLYAFRPDFGSLYSNEPMSMYGADEPTTTSPWVHAVQPMETTETYHHQYSFDQTMGDVAQHDLTSRVRSDATGGGKRDDGSGYAPGIVPVSESIARARSVGAGHMRNSKSEDMKGYPIQYSNPAIHAIDGRLAPPSTSSPRRQRKAEREEQQEQPPPSIFGTYPEIPQASRGFAPAPMSGTSHFGTYLPSDQAALRDPRTPYIYHSPLQKKSPKPRRSPTPSASPSGSEDDRSGGSAAGGSIKSKTTSATIEAAVKRRKAGTQAKFACELCGETFTRRYNLKGHERAHRNEKPFACSHVGCDKAFARSHDCKRHELLHANTRKYHCQSCEKDFVRLDALQRHHRTEVGQDCVEKLLAAGFEIGYDTTVTP